MRAALGQYPWVLLGTFAAMLVTTLFEGTETSIIVFGMIWGLGLFLVLFYLQFWMVRAFAAGSLRAARILFMIISFGAPFVVVKLVWDIFDFAAVDTQPDGSGDWSRPLLAVYVAAGGMALFIGYLFLTGAVRFLRFRESFLLPLFLNHNYQRKFWPGRAMLLRALWTLLEVPTLLNQKVSRRVVIAALVALSLEGGVFDWMVNLPGKIDTNLLSSRVTSSPPFCSAHSCWLPPVDGAESG
jgi:hypothetical protein